MEKSALIEQILNSNDPNLGEEWWTKVLSLKCSSESFATIEKLNLLALCNKISNRTRVLWLLLLEASKVTKAIYAIPKLDYDFRRYVQSMALNGCFCER